MTMRKLRILGLALFAVVVFGAVMATGAFAEGEWLVEGAAVTGELAAETEGEFELINYESSGSEIILGEELCSYILDQTILQRVLGRVQDLLNLMEALTVGTLLTETGDTNKTSLTCTFTEDKGLTDCENGLIEVYVENLSLELGEIWHDEILIKPLQLMYLANMSLETVCKTLLGITGENTCEGGSNASLVNEAGTTPASVLEVFEATPKAERMSCTLTGTQTGELRGTSNLWAVGGELERLVTAVS